MIRYSYFLSYSITLGTEGNTHMGNATRLKADTMWAVIACKAYTSVLELSLNHQA